jgi:hypothetical protein
VGFIPEMQRWFNICKSVSVINHTNIMKHNHRTILEDPEKACDKIQHSFMMKSINKLGIEGKYLNITTVIIFK